MFWALLDYHHHHPLSKYRLDVVSYTLLGIVKGPYGCSEVGLHANTFVESLKQSKSAKES
jgi:hypothetical protein